MIISKIPLNVGCFYAWILVIYAVYVSISTMKEKKTYIYGKHALVEALSHAPKSIKKIFLSPHIKDEELLDLITKNSIPLSELSGDAKSGRDTRDANHQGVVALVANDGLMQSYTDFVNELEITPDTSLVIMGELQDPQNIGAVIRSAAAFGVSGVLMPTHNQGQVTGAVVKVSAGMAFRIPLVTIGNINDTIRDLKKRGFWVYGLAGDADVTVTDEKFDSPTVFVLGNESKGVREKTRELCDFMLSIPMDKKCESLNAAASAAIALYAWSAKHPDAITENKQD